MNLPDSFTLLAQAFGWAVVHSMWQIALVWLVFNALSWAFRGKNQLIYLLSLASMLGAGLWFCATFLAEFAEISETAQMAIAAPQNEGSAVVSTENHPVDSSAPTLLESATYWLEDHTVLVGWAWVVCVALLWLRLLGGWWMAQQLRRRDVLAPGTLFQEQCNSLAQKLKIKTWVRLLESPHVTEPLTLGFWKPLVLFPTGMLLSLSPAQVEALLLHELAHIRRHDYLVNLLQLALETCFFYHPLFWLISRDARIRREFCCDDVVLFHTSDPILYAKTLTDLQLSLFQPTTPFTMNATGKSRFTERIWRIAGISPHRASRPNWILVLLLPTIIAVCSWWPSQAASPSPDLATLYHKTADSDSLPPQKAALPAPKAARPKEAGKPAEPNSQISPDQKAAGKPSPKVAIEAVKMNVLYIGVDNPLRIAVDGVPSEALMVKLEGNGTIQGGEGKYNVMVTQPGEVTISVFRRTNAGEEWISSQKYRVKRIPDPAPRLDGKYHGGIITKEKLLAAQNLQAILENFDFDAVCEVIGYQATVLGKDQDPVTMDVVGSAFPVKLRQLFENLSGNGDAIFFDDIKVKCPGDAAARNLGAMAFKLKPAE